MRKKSLFLVSQHLSMAKLNCTSCSCFALSIWMIHTWKNKKKLLDLFIKTYFFGSCTSATYGKSHLSNWYCITFKVRWLVSFPTETMRLKSLPVPGFDPSTFQLSSLGFGHLPSLRHFCVILTNQGILNWLPIVCACVCVWVLFLSVSLSLLSSPQT